MGFGRSNTAHGEGLRWDGVKITQQKELGIISRDRSVPLAHLWLEVCPGQEHWQETGRLGCSVSRGAEDECH